MNETDMSFSKEAYKLLSEFQGPAEFMLIPTTGNTEVKNIDGISCRQNSVDTLPVPQEYVRIRQAGKYFL
jgi:hypothetical protein